MPVAPTSALNLAEGVPAYCSNMHNHGGAQNSILNIPRVNESNHQRLNATQASFGDRLSNRAKDTRTYDGQRDHTDLQLRQRVSCRDAGGTPVYRTELRYAPTSVRRLRVLPAFRLGVEGKGQVRINRSLNRMSEDVLCILLCL